MRLHRVKFGFCWKGRGPGELTGIVQAVEEAEEPTESESGCPVPRAVGWIAVL